MGNNIKSKDLMELEIVKNFTKLYSKVTGLMLDVNDPDGRHLKRCFSKNQENLFCKIIRSSKAGETDCIQSGRDRGKISSNLKKPVIYECHAGLIDTAVPILLGDKHIATLITGQFLMRKPTEKKFEKIKDKVKNYGIDLNKLKNAYFKTPVISKEKIKNSIKLIELIVSYILEVEDKIIFLKNNNYDECLMERVSYYIENYYNQKVRVTDIAKFVCLSPYYFEHLFKEESGTTFIKYLNCYRIAKAKRLLHKNDILTVSRAVGFDSISHFYKLFKDSLGCTPGQYIKNLDN